PADRRKSRVPAIQWRGAGDGRAPGSRRPPYSVAVSRYGTQLLPEHRCQDVGDQSMTVSVGMRIGRLDVQVFDPLQPVGTTVLGQGIVEIHVAETAALDDQPDAFYVARRRRLWV